MMPFSAFILSLPLIFSPLSFAQGVEVLEDNYATFQRVCMADGLTLEDVDHNGNYKEREDNQVCPFVSPRGEKLYPAGDDLYKIVVNWVTPQEEDTWDELALYYNNVSLKFGDRGMTDWMWDGFKVFKDQKGVFALIAKRSVMNEKDQHYFVVSLNKDQSCRVRVSKKDQFKGLNAFKDEAKAFKAALKLQNRNSADCERRAEYIN